MLTELSQASPASRSQSLASEMAKRMSATCSERSSEWLMKLEPPCFGLKTSPESCSPCEKADTAIIATGCQTNPPTITGSACPTLKVGESKWVTAQVDLFNPHQSQEFLDSFPKAGLMRVGCLYPRPTWERRMVGRDGGASLGEPWKSPNTRDHHAQGPRAHRTDRQECLVDQVERRWHTPHGQANVDHTGKIGGGGELDMQIREFRTRGGDRSFEMGLDNQVKQWPSPRTTDANGSGEHGTGGQTCGLASSAGRNWSTPVDDDANNVSRDSGAFKSLTRDVQNWATPTDDDANNRGAPSQFTKGQGGRNLNVQIEAIEHYRAKDESLNPDWEEILMGWEIGWTDPTQPCATFPGFPMGQGFDQFCYEPPRTRPRKQMSGRTARIKMIGNGIVPQCATAAFVRLLLELTTSSGVGS